MRTKKQGILLLAMVGLAGIAALAIAQPASVVITSEGMLSNQTVNDTILPEVVSHAPTGTKVSIKTDVTATFSEPIVISGHVNYAETAPSNLSVTMSNLNTSERFIAKTVNNSNYYRLQTDSTHLHAGDMIRLNASIEDGYTATVLYNITEADIECGGFKQDFFGSKPDLIISEKSETFGSQNKNFTVFYKVENVGDENATKTNTTIYIDGVPMWKDPVGPLAPGEYYNNTVGPFNRSYDRKNVTIRVCADSGDTVNESIGSNNCLENELECPLPNLRPYPEKDCKVKGPDVNGRFSVYYVVTNVDYGYACASNTTINITNVLVNGSVTNISIKKGGIAVGRTNSFDDTVGPYTCACNKEVVVEVCVDGDKRILETNENDNCWVNSSTCPASACKPDLELVDYSGTWLDRANRTFNVTYTVKNVGNANANASTTRISNTGGYCKPPDVIFDPVPALAPGESYTNTAGPFTRLCILHTGEHPAIANDTQHSSHIQIYANYNNTISESNDKNNQHELLFGLPHLYIALCVGHWVHGKNKTFRIEYKVNNARDAGAGSNRSTVYAYIDGEPSDVTDIVPPLLTDQKYGYPWHDRWGIGPLQMPADKETIKYKLCVVQEDGTEKCTSETPFGGGGCIGKKKRFTFGGAWGFVNPGAVKIDESCTFNGDIYYPEGIRIGAPDIVIDGNFFGISGDRSGCGYGVDDHYRVPSGIRNYVHPHGGHDNVTLKNLDVRKFCNGIAIVNSDNNRIENCSVHDNGVEDKYAYGITVVNSNHTAIDNCSVYNNTGNFTHMNVCGGHGINFHDNCNYCEVTNSHVFHNYLSGILASPTCKYLYIGSNLIEDNGRCSESIFCAGVNLHSKGGFGITTNSTVENNVILNNNGSGIYVTQGYTTIKDNIIKGCKNSTNVTVTGTGIFVGSGRFTFTYLYNNTCCENEDTDIFSTGSSTVTYGDDNTCDTTSNYDDEGTIGCNFYCDGVNGVCEGATRNFRCGDIVTESCEFNRSMSCRGCAGDGLIVGAGGITINGAGYALTGDLSGTGIYCNRSAVTIKNLQVEDFSTGIKIRNANTIENCVVRTNLVTGINVSANNGTVRNNQIYDNAGPGIFVGGGNSTFENNTVARNKGYGIYFSPDARGNNITANFMGDNDGMDIYNDNSETNTGDNNTCDMAYNYNDINMTDYNCTYAWTLPDLVISNKFEKWADEESTNYSVTYTVENIGKPKSREAGESTTYLYIPSDDSLTATDRVDPLKPGENHTSTFGHPQKMKNDKDTIYVHADGADEVKENNEANTFYYNVVMSEYYNIEEYFENKEMNNELKNEFSKRGDLYEWDEGAACVAEDGTEYRCGDLDPVMQNCEFNGNMECPAGHGLIIGKSGIIINGKGFAIGRDEPASSCAGVSEDNPGGGDYCGIYNRGYDNVKITNLEILHFCNGIGLHGSKGNPVSGNVIEYCNIHDNGDSAGYSHGVHLYYVRDTTIRNNNIYHNRGTGSGCGGGGNGIFLYAGGIKNANNYIFKNDLHDNDRAGFFTKEGMQDCTIKNNNVWGNSRGSGIEGMAGGLVLQCVQSDRNTIENNEVWDNYDRGGIFIGGNKNILSKNEVHDNKGDGIYMGRGDGGSRNNILNDNEVCDNEGKDIRALENYGTTGDNNFCDTTEYYNDSNAQVDCKCSQPCSNVSKPDLAVTEKFETWVVEGERYNVTYTVKNVGKANANASTTRIQIVNKDDKDDPVPALAPNKTFTSTTGPFTMSDEKSETIEVCADINFNVEADGSGSWKTNNCMKNTWIALPDLIVTDISVPSKLSFGTSNTITATIKNNGTFRTNKAFTVALFIDRDTVPVDSAKVAPGLTDGSSTTVEFSWTPLALGDYTLITVVADWEGEIHESNEDNNERTITITEEAVEYEMPQGPGGRGGGRPPAGEESVSGYESGPGAGTGELDGGAGTKELPVNETKALSGKERTGKGHPFGKGGMIETVKVVAPVFLIVLAIIVIALFYSGYYKEKRAHRTNRGGRNKK